MTLWNAQNKEPYWNIVTAWLMRSEREPLLVAANTLKLEVTKNLKLLDSFHFQTMSQSWMTTCVDQWIEKDSYAVNVLRVLVLHLPPLLLLPACMHFSLCLKCSSSQLLVYEYSPYLLVHERLLLQYITVKTGSYMTCTSKLNTSQKTHFFNYTHCMSPVQLLLWTHAVL